jgi:hypothetical protein
MFLLREEDVHELRERAERIPQGHRTDADQGSPNR